MVRGDANLKVYRYDRPGRAHGDVHRFRLALADVEGLHRTRAYLAQEGVTTDWFDFTPATATRRAMTAIRTSAAASVARIMSLTSWPQEPTTAWQRGFLAGIFDAEGTRSKGVLRISNADDEMLRGPRRHSRRSVSTPCSRTGAAQWRPDRPPPRWTAGAHALRPPRRPGDQAEVLASTGIAVKSDADLRVVGIEPLGLEHADVRHHDRHRGLHRQRRDQPQLLRPTDARMAGDGFRAGLRHAGRGQDEPGRRPAPRAGPAVLDARARGARHEHRPLPAGGGPLQADARRHRRAGRLRDAVLHPDERHPAAPGHPAPGRGRAVGPARPRRLHGDLGRRTARRPRAGRADAAGPPRPGQGARRRRPAVRRLPRPRAPGADGRRRGTRHRARPRSPPRAPRGSP